MASFGLIKSFDIDDGQLDGQSPQQCFVLGYELAEIDALLKQPSDFTKLVHSSNRSRLEKSCHDAGREFALNWMQGDSSEEWMTLYVAPKKGQE